MPDRVHLHMRNVVVVSVGVGMHYCVFEKAMSLVGNDEIAVIRELPHKGQSSFQVYSVADDIFKPIRIKAFVNNLDEPSKYCSKEGEIRFGLHKVEVVCRSVSILTIEKKNIILKQVIPSAVNLHAERLSVRPFNGPLRIPKTNIGVCQWFIIPREHHTVGVDGGDFFLYLSAMQSDLGMAWAMPCARLESGRPILGAMNLDPMSVLPTKIYARVAAHEIAHALGFNHHLFKRLNMISDIPNVRGKANVRVISTQKVKEFAVKYYNCPEAPGIELEDEGGKSTSSSHWERRNAMEELMSGVSGKGYYTIMTLAAFHDTGFFKANFSMAEPMKWGNNSGCKFLQKPCITNGVPSFPDLFCNWNGKKSLPSCTSDRMSLGYCTLDQFTEDRPPEYRYFTDPKHGGSSSFMDYCPHIEEDKKKSCTHGTATDMQGSYIGPNSRCVKGVDLRFTGKSLGDVCVNTLCENGRLKVQFHFDSKWYLCVENQLIKSKNLQWSGGIRCPKYTDVCTSLPDVSGLLPPVVLPFPYRLTSDDDTTGSLKGERTATDGGILLPGLKTANNKVFESGIVLLSCFFPLFFTVFFYIFD